MMKFIKNILRKKTNFKTFNNSTAVEAFKFKGTVYYHFEDTFKLPAGRALCALAIYEELRMRCTAEYLNKHIAATEILINKNKLNDLAIINNNLKERLTLAPFPDHIYKLASVIYFDEQESPFGYDFEYNRKKIERWKTDPDILNFFLTIQFQDLIPFGSISKEHAASYFNVAAMIDKKHQQKLHDLLSKKA